MRSSILTLKAPRRGARIPALTAGAAVLTAAALAGGLAITALPAYADVSSNSYTIGTPAGSIGNVVASPSTVAAGSSVNFEVTFTAGTALSGANSSTVTVTPSVALGSTPSNIDLVGGSCVQAGTNGGAYSATGITVNLNSSCSVSSGGKVEVDFTADAPAATGSMTFSASTSGGVTPGTSNTITIGTAGPTLSAAIYGFGANTTYTIGDVTVSGLTASGTALTLTAAATHGTGTITFLNSGSGGAGYSVSVTPSGGSATTDTVTNASASGATVTLTLGTALVSGDTLNITATGQNPPPTSTSTADDVTVAPGNGTPETTGSIQFGGSVSAVSVSPQSLVAGANTIYTVGFQATDAVSPGGDIYLTESAGPTNFSTVTGIEVTDNTQNWHFVATGAVLNSGSATIPVQDTINAKDSVSIILAGVTNPPNSGAISDFTVATSADPVPATAPSYTIGANGSPGVVVSVNPNGTGVTATYTISNLHATASIPGGSGTLKLEAPAGTVFPNNPSFISISDSTTSSGSGTVTAALSGGGTNVVTLTVPNTINSGDVLTITIQDVLNPSTPSSTDSITVVGSVTGPAATPVTTTTTTTAPTTTTTKPKPKPKAEVRDLTTKVKESHGVVGIKVSCTGLECKGTITLTDVTTVVGSYKYSEKAGKTNTFAVYIKAVGSRIISVTKGHTIKVTATVTVSGGTTIKQKITLVG